MDRFRSKLSRIVASFAALALPLFIVGGGRTVRAQSNSVASPDSELIAQFRRVEVASVSDAIEQSPANACT